MDNFDINTALAIVGLIAGVVSVIIAIVAIFQACFFYSRGKDTEGRVESALEGIKSQVSTLKDANSRITDRLARFATAPRNDSAQTAELFATTLQSLPEIALKLAPPSQVSNDPALQAEVTLSYVGLWYYAASTNVWASFCLPRPEDFDAERHALVKRIVDTSAADFEKMSSLVAQLNQQEIQDPNFAFAHLYNEVVQHLQPLIGDTSEQFSRMSKNQP